MDNKLNELLGKRIKELRKSKGYTQEEFSELLGIDSKHLSRIECAKVQPSLNLIKKMADVCKIKLESFFIVEHLNSKSELIKLINDMLKEMDEDKVRMFFKILEGLKD